MTPYQALNHEQPDLSHLRVFGAWCNYTHTKKNQANMDIASDSGIFLGFTATKKNAYILSDSDNKVHIATHKTFDEAGMTLPAGQQPPLSKTLLQAGYTNEGTSEKDTPVTGDDMNVKVVLLSEHAQQPTRNTPDSAGLDLYSPSDIIIEPGSYSKIATDIAIQPMPGTYGQIAARSSFATKDITVLGGVIDRDYTGNIYVIMRNSSDLPFSIKKGDRFAQIIFKQIWTPAVEIVTALPTTTQGAQGFGSTETRVPLKSSLTVDTNTKPHQQKGRTRPPTRLTPGPIDISEPYPLAAAVATATPTPSPQVIKFSDNPFDNKLEITIDNKGDHPTLRLDVVHHKDFDKVQLISCSKGTPAGKILRWRSTLRDSFVLAVDHTPISDITSLKKAIQQWDKPTIMFTFGTIEKQAMHPQTGVPQLYFDQLNHIRQHLFTLNHDMDWISDERYRGAVSASRATPGVLPKNKRRGLKLTRKKLKMQDDWDDWLQSEHKQLNQYAAQKTFGTPRLPPPKSNILPLLWTYIIKDDGTKKA